MKYYEMESNSKKVTSIVLKRFHCIEQDKELQPKQHYVSTFERVEQILSKDKYLRIIKIENWKKH